MKEKKGCGNGGGEKGKLKSLRRKRVYKLLCSHFVLNCNLFTHGALKSSEELVEKCPCDPDRIGIWKGWGFFNPFAPGDFAEKRVLKLVEWFSGHCRATKS